MVALATSETPGEMAGVAAGKRERRTAKRAGRSSGGVGSSIADFEFICQLGEGAHGVVNKVRSKVDGKTYVIKEVKLRRLREKARKAALAEVAMLKGVQHPNIIRFYNSFLEKSKWVLTFRPRLQIRCG